MCPVLYWEAMWERAGEGVGVNLARIVLVFNGQYREIVIIQHSLSLRFDRVAVRANLLFLIGQLLL